MSPIVVGEVINVTVVGTNDGVGLFEREVDQWTGYVFFMASHVNSAPSWPDISRAFKI